MKVLVLGPARSNLMSFLQSLGDDIVSCSEKLAADAAELTGVDFIVSYGYRYILKDDILRRFPKRAVNLHISLLPWNRGADPNLWSFLEDTPKGVTIHYMDAGIDTGELIAQAEISYSDDDTLRTVYDRLSSTIERLFTETWPSIRSGSATAFKQRAGGTYHRSRDKAEYEHLLHAGWDTPVKNLVGRAVVGKEKIQA